MCAVFVSICRQVCICVGTCVRGMYACVYACMGSQRLMLDVHLCHSRSYALRDALTLELIAC